MSKSILLIEDNEKHSFIMEDLLSDEGYEAETARDGDEAERIMAEREKRKNPFDLILVDIMVSKFDAKKFIKKYFGKYRIIVVSAYADNVVFDEKWVIKKPFDNYVFIERVKERLNLPV